MPSAKPEDKKRHTMLKVNWEISIIIYLSEDILQLLDLTNQFKQTN